MSPALVPRAGEALLEVGLPDTERSNEAASPALRLDPDVEEISALERWLSFCTGAVSLALVRVVGFFLRFRRR